jgi:hypothetical protein
MCGVSPPRDAVIPPRAPVPPLRGYRYELLVLALVALASLAVVNLAGPQDRTRYELTRHVVLYHTLTIEPGFFDRAQHGGHTYSDKAPGMSFLAVPAYEVERLLGVARAPSGWQDEGDLSLWGLRVATSGLLFLLATFLVGRTAEALVPRTGAATAVVFGAATIVAPLAPTFFEHDAAACFAFLAFVFAWRQRRRAMLVGSGLAAGVAVLFDYSTGLIVLALAVYVVVQARARIGWFLLGGVPAALALGAYDLAAFGSPFHVSYSYEAGPLAHQQRGGFLGIGVPSLSGIDQTLFVDRGALVFSPVLVACAVGLVLMYRRGYRGEAAVAGFVTVALTLADAGYFLPYGGGTPGPRFLAASIPFLCLGLPFALERFRRTVLALALVSIVLTTADAVTWGIRDEHDRWYPGRGFNDLSKTVWVWLGAGRVEGAGIVLLCALGAFALGVRNSRGTAVS